MRQPVPDDDPVLSEAEAVLDSLVSGIFYKKGVSAEEAAFYQAHEFGHHFLDSTTGACSVSDIDVTMPEERIPLGIQRVEGYGPRERRECQANVFAREFLLPSSEARRLFSEEGISAADIAKRLGVQIGLVHQQLARALLVPELQVYTTPSLEVPAPDASQRVAAEAESGPHLIEAGPGTGKTRTLIARMLDRSVASASCGSSSRVDSMWRRAFATRFSPSARSSTARSALARTAMNLAASRRDQFRRSGATSSSEPAANPPLSFTTRPNSWCQITGSVR